MSTEVVKELNAAERVELATQTQRIAKAPWPKLDVKSGHQFVFAVHFDGTRNDRDNLALSGSPFPTNVALLDELMAPYAEDNENYVSHYEPGVGTNPDNWAITQTVKAGVGPSGDMRAAAENAYELFSEQALEWLKNHPDADPNEALKVIATGFSRGGGTAAIFSQLLYQRGLKDPQNGKILVEPGTLGLSGGLIYDPVITGYEGNERFSPTSRDITVVRSQHEYREDFRGVDYGDNPNIHIVEVMGNHCDIGGGYDRGISARVLENSRELISSAGTPINPLSDEMRYRDDEPVQIHHEDRLIFPVTHDPEHGVETGAARHLAPPSEWARELRDGTGWRGFNSIGGTTVWSKDYPEADPDTGGIRRAVSVEGRRWGWTGDLYLTHHDGQIGHYPPRLGGSGKLSRQDVDRLSAQELAPGQADIEVNGVRPQQIVPSRYSREIAARGESDTLASDPPRARSAIGVQDEVTEVHAQSPRKEDITSNAQSLLAEQLRQGRPLLDPRLAGIESETLRDKIASSPTLQTLLKDTEAEHRPYASDIFNGAYQEGMNGEALVKGVMTERKRRFPTLKRNDPNGWKKVQQRLTHSEQQMLERLQKETGAEASSTSARKPEHVTTVSLPDTAPAQHQDPKQRQAEMAAAFKKDPVEAVNTYAELEVAHKTLQTVRSRAGKQAAAAMHKYLSRRIELDKAIPTPQQAMKMVQNALDQGR